MATVLADLFKFYLRAQEYGARGHRVTHLAPLNRKASV